jgi:hypothetical protein
VLFKIKVDINALNLAFRVDDSGALTPASTAWGIRKFLRTYWRNFKSDFGLLRKRACVGGRSEWAAKKKNALDAAAAMRARAISALADGDSVDLSGSSFVAMDVLARFRQRLCAAIAPRACSDIVVLDFVVLLADANATTLDTISIAANVTVVQPVRSSVALLLRACLTRARASLSLTNDSCRITTTIRVRFAGGGGAVRRCVFCVSGENNKQWPCKSCLIASISAGSVTGCAAVFRFWWLNERSVASCCVCVRAHAQRQRHVERHADGDDRNAAHRRTVNANDRVCCCVWRDGDDRRHCRALERRQRLDRVDRVARVARRAYVGASGRPCHRAVVGARRACWRSRSLCVNE